jgi:hypothetical protein
VQKQKEYAKNCNKCWINFHRKYDIVLLRNLEKILPEKVIEVFYGKYQRSVNKNISYKKIMSKK